MVKTRAGNLTLDTDIHFIFNFQISNLFAMVIRYIQCLLRVGVSILAGVFLTSSFCVVPKFC